MSLQPNAGSQGDTPGCWIIAPGTPRAAGHRNICLIPESAHGTNPAGADGRACRWWSKRDANGGNVDPPT